MSSSSTASSNNYVQSYLPPDVITKLEAGAFRSLRQHLEERSDRVANMDLMTISGFCRNCLAKVTMNQQDQEDDYQKKRCVE
jgi:hypothetical protein